MSITTHRVKYDYRPPGQTLKEFHTRPEFIRGVIGPLGSGKTISMIAEILRHIDTQPPDQNGVRRTRVVIARNTLPDLMTTAWKDFTEVTEQMGVGTHSVGTPPMWKGDYIKASDGTKCQFEVIGLAMDDSTDQKKARGLQLSAVWVNEIAAGFSRANFDMLASRVGRYPSKAQVPDAKPFVIFDTNMADRDHWLIKLALELKPEGWWFGIQPPAVVKKGGQWEIIPGSENSQNLPDLYYHRLLQGRPEAWIRQNLANEAVFLADGRPVHPDFAESLHSAVVRPTPGIPLTVGIDFGRTPACCVIQQQHSGTVYVLDELTTENMGALQFGKILKEFMNKKYPNFAVQFFGDPAGNAMSQSDDSTPFAMLEKSGITAWPCHTNDYEERTSTLDNILRQITEGRPAFLIDPRCTQCIKGLAGSYMFRRVRVSGEERYHDTPVKDITSHVVESLHYGLLGMGLGDQLFSTTWQEEYDAIEVWRPKHSHFQ